MSISIVVLAYNRRDSLRELLGHLQALQGSLHELVVVDNASEDGTDEMVASEFGWVVYHRNPTNLGACGRGRGIAAATGDLVITLDDDIFGLTPQDLALVEEIFAAEPALGVLNFRVVDYFDGQLCNWVHHCPTSKSTDVFETYEITEGAVAFRRSAFVETGGYWEEFFIGHEGPDLAFRMMDAGYAVRYDGRIEVRHKHEQTGRLGWRFYYYDTRNQILLAARRMHFGQAFRYLFIGLGAMAVYSVRDRFLRYWFKGIFDGLRMLPAARRTRQPMSASTAARVREIDRERPSFWVLARKRLFGAANRLDG